jgi:hypothetical protein
LAKASGGRMSDIRKHFRCRNPLIPADFHSVCVSAIKILETFICRCQVFTKYHTD